MRRRRSPWWLLLAAFALVALVEIYVIIQVDRLIGPWWTILLLIADSVFGSWLVKREGRKAWRALRYALEERRMPSAELADGALIVIGGIAMLTPGFVLDIAGALCLLPFTRPLARRVLAAYVGRRLARSATYVAAPGAHWDATARPAQDDVVPGQVVD